MNIERGEIYWVDFGEPSGSEPAERHPALVVQANPFNKSRIATVIVAVITSNLKRADAPGNVYIDAQKSGLPYDSVINVSQIATIDKSWLEQLINRLDDETMDLVNVGLRLVFGLDLLIN